MKKKEFYSEVGATAACTLRLMQGSQFCGDLSERKLAEENGRRHRFAMDSWFGSVKLAEHSKLVRKIEQEDGSFKTVLHRGTGHNRQGHEIIAAVKTNKAHYPLKQIKKIMKKWPSGSHLVFECTAPETGVELVALGYKYNSKKVLCFVMTKNAGSTAIGDKPYVAKFADEHGNVKQRSVKRPAVLSVLFGDSDAIDSHNHCRQFRLRLESLWLTPNPWFRINCTIVGQTVIDCFRALNFHCSSQRQTTVAQFANALAWDCVHNTYSHSSSSRNNRQNPLAFIPTCSQRRNVLPREAMAIEGVRSHFHSAVDELSEQFIGSLRLASEEVESTRSLPVMIGGGGRDSFASSEVSQGSTLTGTSPGGHDGYTHVPIGNHDIEKNTLVTKNDRPVRRMCAICKMKTAFHCSHVECKAYSYNHAKGKMSGVPLCGGCIVRKDLDEYGYEENTRTCLEIHRDNVRQTKLEVLKARYGA